MTGTKSITELVDEIEINSIKIQSLTENRSITAPVTAFMTKWQCPWPTGWDTVVGFTVLLATRAPLYR
jgi:hypothetical protein